MYSRGNQINDDLPLARHSSLLHSCLADGPHHRNIPIRTRGTYVEGKRGHTSPGSSRRHQHHRRKRRRSVLHRSVDGGSFLDPKAESNPSSFAFIFEGHLTRATAGGVGGKGAGGGCTVWRAGDASTQQRDIDGRDETEPTHVDRAVEAETPSGSEQGSAQGCTNSFHRWMRRRAPTVGTVAAGWTTKERTEGCAQPVWRG
ncbi:hypothetical protein DFH08DRAFT_808604 [Mycena albidolilacea]|uniref:Uncharacterized protein n=1 Tax=Mycena albidolilacea TaxID=1033008 RepID=A0AAD7A1W2_9AGAR|nr:hypothetical protein DFH08DRAFT_808604 [Mycena albidolilacea]